MDIICFANDWDGDPLSKKHIMKRLAQRGSRVLWVNSLGNRAPRVADAKDWTRAAKKLARFAGSALAGPRQVAENLWVLDPIAIPAYGSDFARKVNATAISLHVRSAAARLGLRDPVHYTFVPASAWVAGRLGESLLVYHAADEYSAFGGADAQAILGLEDTLLQRADLYVACSQPLLDAKRARCRRSTLLRHGVEHDHFARALDPTTPPAGPLADIQGPIAGFIGLVAEWVDLEAMGAVADALARRGGTLVVVGEIRGTDASTLAARPNVIMTGRRPYAELPGYCKRFDVGLLPFRVDTLTKAANPLKLKEYLAAGLPVVSTDIPEARALADLVEPTAPGALRVATSTEEFVRLTLDACARDDRGPREVRSRAVAGEGWDAKVDELQRTLEGALPSLRNSASF